MDRGPIVAGQFYTAEPDALAREVRGYMDRADASDGTATLLAMVPHAGYVFSGAVAGRTLGAASLASTVLLLGPNHTGRGSSLAVWPEGRWLTPGGGLPVDAALASDLLAAEPRLEEDREAHLMEHSLEVVLPFLEAAGVSAMVPVCVSEHRLPVLESVAGHMAEVLARCGKPVSVVVSSDMSHYVSHERARSQDSLALEAALALDPAGLYEVVRRNGISMCGVLPMTLGLFVARALGAASARLAAYATSGEVSGDFARVVGYAGLLVN